MVHNAEEFVNAVKEKNPMVNVNEDNAEFFYQKNVFYTVGNKFDGNIMWPEANPEYFEGVPSVHFFETQEDLTDYILSGEDPELTLHLSTYTPPKDFSLSNLYHDSGFSKTMENLGIPAAAGVGIFALYELVQYGLAIPTQGASLALPF